MPYLQLKGISSGDMADVLRMLVGDAQARGFSAGVVSRLKQVWEDEYKHWVQGDLSRDKWVYIWADGTYSGLRSDDVKLCALGGHWRQ